MSRVLRVLAVAMVALVLSAKGQSQCASDLNDMFTHLTEDDHGKSRFDSVLD